MNKNLRGSQVINEMAKDGCNITKSALYGLYDYSFNMFRLPTTFRKTSQRPFLGTYPGSLEEKYTNNLDNKKNIIDYVVKTDEKRFSNERELLSYSMAGYSAIFGQALTLVAGVFSGCIDTMQGSSSEMYKWLFGTMIVTNTVSLAYEQFRSKYIEMATKDNKELTNKLIE